MRWRPPPRSCAGATHDPEWKTRRTESRDALHAEWTKVRTTAATAWLLLAIAVLTIALSTVAAAAVQYHPGVTRDLVKISLTGVQLGQVLVAVLAVHAICGEYGTGMIVPTLTAMPRRHTMLAAKSALVAALVLAAGAVGVLGSLLAGRLILPSHGFTSAHGYPPLSLADASTLRAVVGSVLYLALVALLSLGIATLVRDAAIATGSVLGRAVPVPDPGRGALRSRLDTAPPTNRSDQRRPHHPGHERPAGPAHRPMERPRRAGGLGRRRPPRGGADAAQRDA